jgi:hypothetical protein
MRKEVSTPSKPRVSIVQECIYKASRALHSVIRIPEPEEAAESHLQFYQASFRDFLLDSNRSGKYTICERKVLVDILRLLIYWYDVDGAHFHTHDGKPDSGEIFLEN